MLTRWLRSARVPTPTRPRVVPRLEGLERRDVPTATVIASGLADPYGSTVGPGGDLYVTEGAAGRIARINPRTGDVSTFASGLPICPIPGFFGVGAVDVEFLGRTAYVLVSSVAADLGGSDVVGIYRVDGLSTFTVVADIGAWQMANPPDTSFEVPTGSPIAMVPYRGGFLVSDSHHNRVLDVRLDGTITEVIAFDNVVPTGLELQGNRLYLGIAGPLPHLPEDGKIVSFRADGGRVTEEAAGSPLIVDVEFGRGNALYALSGGDWDGIFPGDPALPDTGAFVRVNRNGTFTVLEAELDRPSSLEFIRGTAYVITLAGEVLRIDDDCGESRSVATQTHGGEHRGSSTPPFGGGDAFRLGSGAASPPGRDARPALPSVAAARGLGTTAIEVFARGDASAPRVVRTTADVTVADALEFTFGGW